MARYANACLQPFSFSKSYALNLLRPLRALVHLQQSSTANATTIWPAGWIPLAALWRPAWHIYVGASVRSCRCEPSLSHPIIPEAGVDQSADQGVAIIGRESCLKQPINQLALDLGTQACPLPPKYLPPPTITVPKLTLHILHNTTRMKALRILPSQIRSKKWESRLKLAEILRSRVAQESRGR